MKILIAALAVAFTLIGNTDKPINYAALGDSITTGYGLSDENDCFAEKLSDEFGFDLNNLAQNGATSADLLASLSDEEFCDVVKKADIITVSIGGNDVLSILVDIFFSALSDENINLDGGVSQLINEADSVLKRISEKIGREENLNRLYKAADNFCKNYDDILIKLKSLNPEAKLYIQTLYNPFAGIPAFKEFNSVAELVIEDINNPIYDNSQKYDYEIVDTYINFKSKSLMRTNIMSLDVHPNKNGHNAIYELLKKAIAKMVSSY